MFAPSRSRLLQPLMLSLIIHALALIAVISVFPARLDMPSATMNVVFNAATPQTLVRSRLDDPAVPAEAKPPVASKPGARQLIAEKSPVAALVVPSSPALTTVPPAPAVAVSGAVDAPREQSGAQASAPALSRDGVNADDLRQYRISLAIAARRFKRYPLLARERGWEGTAEIALSVSAHLPVPEVTVVRSSGHAALDRQAQEMMVQAAGAAVLPESLKGRDLRLLLPVQFSLEGDQ